MKHVRGLVLSLTMIALIVVALVVSAAPLALAAPQTDASVASACTPITPGTWTARANWGSGQNLWHFVDDPTAGARQGMQLAVNPVYFQSYTLSRNGMAAILSTAPMQYSDAARQNPLVLSLPNPCGEFERFAVQESPIMEPGLAARHPDIKTYSGRGIDNPAATIRFDLTPLGFHGSVRSPQGAWYIDPYFHLDDSIYAVYFGHNLAESPHGTFVEREADSAEISVDEGYRHAADLVTLHGSGFAANAAITIEISDPEDNFAPRTLSVTSDALGSFDATFVADPRGDLDTHIIEAINGDVSALASYQVVHNGEDTSHPPTGDVLRTYRLALITDPGYAAYFGGPPNVTPAKVTLINRVDQIYQEDMSILMVLVNDNDLLNLDTWAQAISPNGPCGTAGCFTQSQVTGCSSTTRARYVVGQIIGASNYDIGHLALGQPGGGVANLGVVGRSNKAGGCTGIPTPVGDFYAVDYVAHEMGHQFSGNHPFNGNQLNCSGGNRSAANSVEPGSGSSVMAYAGICLTDDLQAHSDPYFSQRSLQEISNYTTSSQSAINEVQTASLRHFGGGNEIQVVTFGPGYSKAATVQPLSLTINASPSTTSRGGAEEVGNTVTIATSAAHTLQIGDTVTIAGVGVVDYDGTWTVTAIPTSRSFQYTNPTAGLATSGGGTVTLAVPGATEAGTTVTISTSAAHSRSVGDVVVISGVGVSGYNGTWTITAVPTARTFEYTAAVSGLANSGSGTMTYYSPFQVRIGGNDSGVIGGTGLPYTAANIQAEINAIAGFAGTVTVSGAASTGFTVTYSGASAGLDVPSIELVNLSCGGCFASVEETNHGGTVDSFTVNYAGNDSAVITNGVDYTSAGIKAAIEAITGWPAGATVTIANFGGGGSPSVNGFMVTFGGALATTDVPVLLALTNMSAGSSGFFGETDKGGPVDNKGGIITATGNTWPSVTAPVEYTIPLRTPFALTGEATDAEGDTLIYSWEQNDRGGSAGTSLLNNTKVNGALFAMFPFSAQIEDPLIYNVPTLNQLTTDPTRVFPDLQQILDNNTNAEMGVCPTGPIAPTAPINITECYSEFLPTIDYLGYTGINASPLSLHFRFTVRDGLGGTNNAGVDTTLLLATNAGPFLVTSPNTAVVYASGSTQTVTWDKANTDIAPVSADNVNILLSTDGGYTYPYVLAASTLNDGSELVTLPNIDTTEARVKIEGDGNIFFDISNSDFTIQGVELQVTKSDGDMTAEPGDTVAYTLTYTNTAGGGATGVVLTETVPANTTFNPGASTAGWVCVPDNNAGSTCTLAVGAVAGGSGSAATFAVDVDEPLLAQVTEISNTACIGDDGSSGPDLNPDNNCGDDTTPLLVGSITVAKVTAPAGGAGFDFSGDLGSFSLDDGGQQPFSGLGSGDYDVTEIVPAGWSLTDVLCVGGDSTPITDGVTVNLDPGENIICTFTNQQNGTVIVEKLTNPPGAPGNFIFTGTPAGTISHGGQLIASDLTPGTYQSTEDDPSPDFLLVGIVCDDDNSGGDAGTRTATFNLDPGETVTCIFTNQQLPMAVEMSKEVNGPTSINLPSGGGVVSYTVAYTNTGLLGGTAVFTDTPGIDLGMVTCSDLNPAQLGAGQSGSQVVDCAVEITPDRCVALDVTLQNTVVATFTPSGSGGTSAPPVSIMVPPSDPGNPLCDPQFSIVLTKTVGLDPLTCAVDDMISVPSGGIDVTYCYTVQNTGNISLTAHSLVDTELGTILSSFPYVLTPGASHFVTVTTNIATTTVNTATWTAISAAPIGDASSTDSATVVVTPPTAVRLAGLAATTRNSPLPAGAPLAALPAAASTALAAAWAIRRRRQ